MLDKVKVVGLVGAIAVVLRLVLDVDIPPDLVKSVEAAALAIFSLVSVYTSYLTPERQKNIDKLNPR